MRRIRFLAHLDTELRVRSPTRAAPVGAPYLDAFLVDPTLFDITVGLLSGPEVPPAETFTPEFEQKVLSLG